jgi:hypothetical protein
MEFQRHINVNAVATLVGAALHFLGIREPQKLAVKSKMHREEPALQPQQQVLAFALDTNDSLALGSPRDSRSTLRLRRYSVKHMDAPNPPALNERAKRPCNRFYFGQFRHDSSDPRHRRMELRTPATPDSIAALPLHFDGRFLTGQLSA